MISITEVTINYKLIKMRKFNFLLFLLSLPLSIFSQDLFQSKINTYTQLLISEWEILKNDGNDIGYIQELQSKSYDINIPQNIIDLENTFVEVEDMTYLKCFIRTDNEDSEAMLRNYNAIISSKAGNIYSCKIPYDSLNSLVKNNEIIAIEASRPAVFAMDSVRRTSNIDPIHDGLTLNKTAYKGEGVIIGMVDVGFDFTHPNFYDEKGEKFRIKEVWCQSDNKNSDEVDYGAIYKTPEEIRNKKTDTYTQNHGTHTTGIAAGGGYNTPYTGVAPESELILVGTNLYTKGILDGVSHIIKKAKEESKPCVINLSLGSKLGPKDGTSSEDIMIDNLVGPGVIIVGSAGNSGGENLHMNKVFNGSKTDTLKSFIMPASGTSYCYTDIWGRGDKPYKVQVQLINTYTNEVIYETPVNAVNNSSKVYKCTGNINSYNIYVMNTKSSGNGQYNSLVYISTTNYKSFSSPEYMVIKVFSDYETEINVWGDKAVYSNLGRKNYESGDNNSTILCLGGVGKQIISVGAYTTKNQWTSFSSGSVMKFNSTLYDIAYFSSRGPTADKRIKPDISAPGYAVASSFSSYNTNYGETHPWTVCKREFNGRNYYWGLNMGTSMAAPVVTGTLALWLQADPSLTPDKVRSIISEKSFSPNETRSLAADNTFGWGKIDALGGLKYIESIASNIIKIEDNNIKYSISKDMININSDIQFDYISISDIQGREIMRYNAPKNGVGFNKDFDFNYNLNIDNLDKGTYIILMKGKSVSKSIKFIN